MKAAIVYADESGTHDRTGAQPGSEFPTIAGYAAPPSEWSSFCVEWKAVLKSFGAPYFHSREFRAAKSAIENHKKETPELKRNPYYGWDLKRLDKFLFVLAKVAGKGNKVIIAGAVRVSAFNRIKSKLETDNPEQIQLGDDPYKYSMGEFFHIYHRETFRYWGNFKCPVTFFFDRSDDPKWISAIHEVYEAFSKKDLRMKGVSFVDKKDETHLPLQAADMLAYYARKSADKLSDNTFNLDRFDRILLNNLLRNAAKTNPGLATFLRGKQYE